MPRARTLTGRSIVTAAAAAEAAAGAEVGDSYEGPGDVSTNIIAWWDAQHVTLEAEAGDDEIVSFTDRSGRGMTLTRDADGQGFLLNSVELNGLDTAYGITSCGYAVDLGTVAQPFSVFTVVKGQDQTRTLLSSNGDKVMVRTTTTSTGTLYMYGENNSPGSARTMNVFRLWQFDWGQTTMDVFEDGTAIDADTTNNTNPSITNPFRVGRNEAAGEDWLNTNRFVEMVIYNDIKAGADLAAIEQYFEDKYALTIA